MDDIPKRRQGIDGLSHRPAAPAAPTRSRPADTPPHKSTAPHAPAPNRPNAEQGFDFNPGVSHPSLPQQTSRIQDRPASSVQKLLGYPFAPGFDRRIFRLGLASTALDIRFWLLLSLPLVLIRITQLASITPVRLFNAIGNLLVARNYIWGAIIIGGFYLAAVISVLAVTIGEQTMTAIKIRRIDHRVSRAHILIRHAVSNILKTALSWLIDLLLASVVVMILVGTLYWLTSGSPVWLAPWRGYVAGVMIVLTLALLGVLAVRRKLQRAMLATTQLGVGTIQARSFSLVLHNVGISSVALLAALLQLGLAAAAIIAVGVGMYHVLPGLSTIPARLSIWLLGAGTMAVVWLAAVLWQVGHWAGLYHIIVLRSHKDEVSDYLVPSEPLKPRLWPALAAATLVLLVLSLYIAGVVAFRGGVTSVGKHIKQSIPSDAGKLIPGIDR